MDNNTIIKKVVEKYKKFNVTEAEVKLLITLAEIFAVPQDAIYPGIKMILNNQYGIEEDVPVTDAAKALVADALIKSMSNN